MDIDWISLPENVWYDIFDCMDNDSRLKSAEASKLMSFIFDSPSNLKKISLKLPFPEPGEPVHAFKKKFKELAAPRYYQHLNIFKLKNQHLEDREMRSRFFTLISRLASSLKSLKIENCNILRHDIIALLTPLERLNECILSNIMMFDDLPPTAAEDATTLSCDGLKTLRLSQCDFFCFMLYKLHEKLERLEIREPSYSRPDVVELENFLLKQNRLKELKLKSIRFNNSYSTNRLANVPFQLDTLSLIDVTWDMNEQATGFLTSQRQLKELELKSFNSWVSPRESKFTWFCNRMQHLLSIPTLRRLTIGTRQAFIYDFKNDEFLPGLTNPGVTSLTYLTDTTDRSEFMQIFVRMFPNISSFTFVDNNPNTTSLSLCSSWKQLNELDVRVYPRTLTNLPLTDYDLKSFKFSAINEEKCSEILKTIFIAHPNIKTLSLDIEPLTVEEITDLLLPLSASLEHLEIKDLHLNPTEAELFCENFLKLRKIKTDRSFTAEVLTILNSHNIYTEKNSLND